MLERCGPLDGAFSAQDDREHRALGMNLVDRTESTAQKLLLSGPIALKPRDVAAKRRHLGLGPFDAVVESPHVALLLSEPALGVLDLREQGCLPAPRLGGLFPLLLELVLGLLELPLLGLHRVVALGLGADRQRAGHQDEGERQEVPSLHVALRPRASQPPKAPRAAPAASRRRTAEVGRNSRVGNPTVMLMRGSSLGAASRYNTTPAARP